MFLLPFLLMMPLAGTLYLLGQSGDEVREKVFEVQGDIPEEKSEKEAFFRQVFKDAGIDYDFQYIRETPTQLIFRPTSRTYMVAKLTPSGAEIFKSSPNLVKIMVELHKGHGPILFRYFEMIFGVGLILMALSGVWLALLVPAYRNKMLFSFGAGAVLFALAVAL